MKLRQRKFDPVHKNMFGLLKRKTLSNNDKRKQVSNCGYDLNKKDTIGLQKNQKL